MSTFFGELQTSFISALKKSLDSVDFHSTDSINALREAQRSLKKRINEVGKLERKGLLSPEEKAIVLELKNKELEEKELEIESHFKASYKTFA